MLCTAKEAESLSRTEKAISFSLRFIAFSTTESIPWRNRSPLLPFKQPFTPYIIRLSSLLLPLSPPPLPPLPSKYRDRDRRIGTALSEHEARGSGSVEEMLPTLLVCGRASVVVGGEGRLLFILRVSMVTTLWCALSRYTPNG